jgi:hypothetical protein
MQKTGVKLLFIVCFLDFHSTACIRNFGTITTFSIICRLCQTNPFFPKHLFQNMVFISYMPILNLTVFKIKTILHDNMNEWMNEWMNTSFTFSTEIWHYMVTFFVSDGTLEFLATICFWWYSEFLATIC